ncbi:MAG: hypothetical protein ABSG53_05805 [Thermoguttaceae bacterium]
MSAPKNKLKQQKMARKRQRKEAARLKRQRKRSEEWSSGTFPIGPSYRFDAPGGVKMSTVLEEFVEPLADDVEGLEEYRKLLGLGQLAWNAALRGEPERGEMVNELLSTAMPGATVETLSAGRSIVEALITRKEQHFADLRRPILRFEVFDTGDGWHLNVASLIV